MKKILVLVLVMSVILCGCGAAKEETKTTVSNETVQTTDIDSLLSDDTSSADDEQDYVDEIKAILEKYEDKPFEDFVKEYGDPLKSEITDSCLGNGGEGNYTYEHFTVYTIINDGEEYIADVR